jgi:hypothetical protein
MRTLLVGIALCGAVPAYAVEIVRDSGSASHSAPKAVEVQAAQSAPQPPARQSAVPEQPASTSAPEPDQQTSAKPAFSRKQLCTTAASAAEAHNLPVRFFANLIQQESGFQPHVVSPAGAQGIAQFMPRVAAEQGLDNPFDPIEALQASAKFVANLVDRFGNLGLAAAAYNAGSRRVSDWLAKRGKLPDETRNYVRNITGRPAEKWVRSSAKGDDVSLPPHARCPGLSTVVADASGQEKPALKDAKRASKPGQRRRTVADAKRRLAASRPGRVVAAARKIQKGSSKRAVAAARPKVRMADAR